MTTPNELEPNVSTPCKAYKEYVDEWTLIQSLLGGTKKMREMGETYLPKHIEEDQPDYERRLKKTFLEAKFSEAVRKIVAKPFQRPVIISDHDDSRINDIKTNVDKSGLKAYPFFKTAMRNGVSYGRSFALVDMPSSAADNLGQAKAKGIRPTFNLVHPLNLIGWSFEDEDSGENELSEIRIVNYVTSRDGWKETCQKQIHVWYPDHWEIHIKKPGDEDKTDLEAEWIIPDGDKWFGENGLGKIPLVSFFADHHQGLTSGIPLQNLAYLNLAHWQSSSEHRNYLSFARIGVWFMKGMGEKKGQRKGDHNKIAPNRVIKSENKDANIDIIEASGSAAKISRDDLADLNEQMENASYAPFVQKSGSITATKTSIDEAKAITEVQSWAAGMSQFVSDCYDLSFDWLDLVRPDDFIARVHQDFQASINSENGISRINEVRRQGDMSLEMFVDQLDRFGFYGDDVDKEDLEVEVERIRSENGDIG